VLPAPNARLARFTKRYRAGFGDVPLPNFMARMARRAVRRFDCFGVKMVSLTRGFVAERAAVPVRAEEMLDGNPRIAGEGDKILQCRKPDSFLPVPPGGRAHTKLLSRRGFLDTVVFPPLPQQVGQIFQCLFHNALRQLRIRAIKHLSPEIQADHRVHCHPDAVPAVVLGLHGPPAACQRGKQPDSGSDERHARRNSWPRICCAL